MATIALVLGASLMGSLHCAGMCGPLVAFAVGGTETTTNRGRALLHVAYHGGRLVTYALLGAVCGLAGAALDLSGSLVGLNRIAAILAGGMMICVGLIAVLRYSGLRLPSLPVPAFLRRLIVWGQKAAVGLRPFPRALTIGLLTALLPCGWLYMFAIVAAGSGSVFLGAIIMTAFWLGTVPVLASLGIGVQTLTGTFGKRVPLIAAIVIVVLGLFTVGSRLTVPAQAYEPPAALVNERDTAEQVKTIGETVPPCCQHHAK